jgi:hypothetical protein
MAIGQSLLVSRARASGRAANRRADGERPAGVAPQGAGETMQSAGRDLVIGIEKVDEGSLALRETDVACRAGIPGGGGDPPEGQLELARGGKGNSGGIVPRAVVD